MHARPIRFAHGQPAPIGFETPLRQPVGLVLLRRNETDDVFRETFGGFFGLDVRREAIFIGVDVDGLDARNGLLTSRHFIVSSSQRVKGPPADQVHRSKPIQSAARAP